jgi:hypothetical protein
MNSVTETKKRGRKPKGETAMSGRTRTLLYRQRRKRAVIDAIGLESQATTPALLELLKDKLTRLDALAHATDDNIATAESVTVAKNTIARILNEIRHRYEIEL